MLENFAARLAPGAELTVGYFGGSITEGAGASEEAQNWQCATFAWLQSQYPQVTFHRIQAAIGGTGSTLGVCRCETDLTCHKPDLVFYEFAVNDNGGDFMELCNNTESILLKIWRANPLAEVIMIYTTTKAMEEKLVTGEVLSSRTAQSAVAYYYNLLQIDVGEALRRAVAKEGFDWLAFTKEGVHPLDNGYKIYADLIIAKLQAALEGVEGAIAAPRALPKPLFTPEGGSRVDAALIPAWEAVLGDGWKRVERSLCGRYPCYVEATEPGAELAFTFTGRRVDAYWMLGSDTGKAELSLDGGEWQKVSAFDHYCLEFDRAGSAKLFDRLALGTHTLRVRVSEETDPRSKGRAIRIGAFCVM